MNEAYHLSRQATIIHTPTKGGESAPWPGEVRARVGADRSASATIQEETNA